MFPFHVLAMAEIGSSVSQKTEVLMYMYSVHGMFMQWYRTCREQSTSFKLKDTSLKLLRLLNATALWYLYSVAHVHSTVYCTDRRA